jgi:hypothetical protein
MDVRIEKDDLNWAAAQGVIDKAQAEQLWDALSERTADQPRFGLVHVLYSFGALVVIGAMGWFMNNAWEVLGGAGIFAISIIYAAVFVGLGYRWWDRPGLRVPSGLLVTMGVCMTPLAVYGIQRWLGVWGFDDPGEYRSFHRWIKGGWFFMELATIATGLIALRFFKFPFLTAPVAFALWYMSMDITPIIFGSDGYIWDQRKMVSMWFGLSMIVGSYFVDRRTKVDFAFCSYLYGVIAFWGGLTLMESDSELSKFIYFLINILMMGMSIFLQRKVFVVFGALGSFAYLGHLAAHVFEDSVMFPFALTIFGALILYCGILLHRHGAKIEKRMIAAMPGWMQRLRPGARIAH